MYGDRGKSCIVIVAKKPTLIFDKSCTLLYWKGQFVCSFQVPVPREINACKRHTQVQPDQIFIEMHEENFLCRRSLNRYAKCDWKDVRVGDIVRLSCDEMIPADILVCSALFN